MHTGCIWDVISAVLDIIVLTWLSPFPRIQDAWLGAIVSFTVRDAGMAEDLGGTSDRPSMLTNCRVVLFVFENENRMFSAWGN